MAYYFTERHGGSALGQRRPAINEYFLSSYTMAIYQGCEFGCTYCDGWAYSTRPLNEAIRVPLDLPERVQAELQQVDRRDLIAISALSDPYQPVEASYRLTRQVLGVFADHGQPCLVMTKSSDILEDLSLLRRINEQSLAIVMFSILTVEPFLAAMLDGKASAPALRVQAISTLKQAGIPVGVALLPLIPYVNDTDYILRNVLEAIVAAGADFVVWDYLHIPNESHRARIAQTLARIGPYPNAYYRDVYRGQPRPNAEFCSARDRELLERCDALNLPVRAPHMLYANKLRPANEATLFLKHHAFRDAVQGRSNLATLHRELAERIYRGQASIADLRASPLWSDLRTMLRIEDNETGR